jgi:hypothetical protein
LASVGNGLGLIINGGRIAVSFVTEQRCSGGALPHVPILNGPLSLLNGRLMAKAPKKPGYMLLTIYRASLLAINRAQSPKRRLACVRFLAAPLVDASSAGQRILLLRQFDTEMSCR